VPNPSDVVKRRGKDPRTCLHQGGRRESCPNPQETTRSPESAKELRRQQKEITQFRGRRFCLPQGLPNVWSQKIPSKREVSSAIHWPLSYHGRIGPAAYRLQLPESMSDIHNVFHVSQLQKCLKVPESHITEE
jgi:hypothetical protein